MRTVALAAFISCIGILGANAQKIQEMDASPMDMSVLNDDQYDTPTMTIIYSRPQVKGRKIFGDLVPYDQVWRTGANESTEFTTYRPIGIQGNELPAGNYTLYTIPGKKEWTVIISSQQFTWGAYDYDQRNDVMRFTVPSIKVKELRENFSIAISGEGTKGTILMAWEHTEVHIEFQY